MRYEQFQSILANSEVEIEEDLKEGSIFTVEPGEKRDFFDDEKQWTLTLQADDESSGLPYDVVRGSLAILNQGVEFLVSGTHVYPA